MTKKADPNVHKYGNPKPVALPRNSKGQFLRLSPSLTKKQALQRKYARKRKRSISICISREEHHLLRLVCDAIGVSLASFSASAILLHTQQIAQQLAIQSGEPITEEFPNIP
jgi:hypothetical protein